MKRHDRSCGHPLSTLAECVDGQKTILENHGTEAQTRDTLAATLGYSNANGGIGARKVASQVHFGLLGCRKGLYFPTDLAVRIIRPGSPADRDSCLRQAARSPALYRKILDRFEPAGRIPRKLETLLTREFGVTASASPAATDTFVRSCQYARVIDIDWCFVTTPKPSFSSELTLAEMRPSPSRHQGLDGRKGEQRFELALSNGGVARIFLPLKLTTKDLQLIRKQLEVLDEQVEGRA